VDESAEAIAPKNGFGALTQIHEQVTGLLGNQGFLYTTSQIPNL
jgi:hypothetical protein